MSRLGLGTQMLSRCGSGWMKAGPVVAPMGTPIGAPLWQRVRQVSTTRPKKAQAMKEATKETTTPLSKGKVPTSSTKTTRNAPTKPTTPSEQAVEETKIATKTRAPKAKTTASMATKANSSTTGKKTTASKTSTPAAAAPASTPKEITEPIITTHPQQQQGNDIPSSTRFAPSSQNLASRASKAPAASAFNPAPSPSPKSRRVPPQSSSDSKPKVDTNSPEYKQAARKWISTMIALPILLVTSYFLFDRLALGNHASLEKIREQIRGGTSGERKTNDKHHEGSRL